MLPQRRPTTSIPPARETFNWPPTTDELDAIEVIVLDEPKAALQARKRTRRIDLAHWGLTLTSLAAIVVSAALQFVNWHGTSAVRQDAPLVKTASTDPGAALAMASVGAASAAGSTTNLQPSIGAVDRVTPPPAPPAPPRHMTTRRAAYVPVRKPRALEREPVSRLAIDSPPLRLPESYVQPRLVSTDARGRVRGQVVLGVQVHANGRVGNIDVLSDGDDGNPNLERAAVAAVKQWRYQPALRAGVPTPARVKIIVKFS